MSYQHPDVELMAFGSPRRSPAGKPAARRSATEGFVSAARAEISTPINDLLGEPVERGGAVVIPVARTRLGRRPAVIGVYVLQDGKVRWEPAFDLTAVALGGQLVGIVALLIVRSIVKGRIHQRGGQLPAAAPA